MENTNNTKDEFMHVTKVKEVMLDCLNDIIFDCK